MPLWSNSTLNTNALASAISKWESLNAFPMVVKRNGLLYQMMRKGNLPLAPGSPKIDRSDQITGNDLVVRLLGKLQAYTPVPDSEQTDVFPLSRVADRFGAARFDWAHFVHIEPLVWSEWRLIRGDEARTISWLEDVLKVLTLSWENDLGNGINSTDPPSRTKIGGWRYAVDDGALYAVYGTIDRADAANADYRSYTETIGSLTIEKVQRLINSARVRGGSPDVGVCGQVPYEKLQGELRGYHTYMHDEWNKFRNTAIGFDSVMFTLDQRCGNGDLLIADSTTWRLYEDPVSDKIVMDTYDRKGTPKAIKDERAVQFICKGPSWNAKGKGITG